MYNNSRWIAQNQYTERYTFEDMFSKDTYRHGIIKTFIDGKPVIGASVEIYGYQAKSFTLSDVVFKLSLHLDSSEKEYDDWSGTIKSNPSGYTLNKNLIILNVSGESDRNRSKKEVYDYSLDELKIPKSVKELKISYLKMTEIPKLNAIVELSNCHVANLSFKHVKELKSFSDVTFDKYDNKMIHCGNHGSGRESFDISIYQIDENKFAITGGKRFVTRAEISTLCSTYGLIEAIEYFGLDKNTKFEFITNGWKDRENPEFEFSQSNNGSVKLAYKNGTFSIFSNASFPWFGPRYDLDWKDGKIGISSDRIWSSDGETLNDTILAEVMKMSADDRFPRGFFTKFIKAINLTSSKHIGEIDIADFKFTMMKLPKEVPHDKLIGVTYDKDKNQWCVRYWIPKTYHPGDPSYKWSRGHTSGGVVTPKIDWGKQAFKFKNKPGIEDSWFLNPEHTHYFAQLAKIGLDQTYLTNFYQHKIRYDETIKYKFDIDKKKLEKKGFMFINDRMFKECDYRMGKDKFYFEGGFYKDMSDTSGHNHGSDDRLKVAVKIKDAETLAKKYGLKLDLKSISREGKYYNKIEIIAKDKYRASRDEENDYVETILACGNGYNTMINQQNPTAINGDSFQDTLLHKVMTPLVKIGDSLYIMCNNMLYKFKIDGETANIEKTNGNCESMVKFNDVLKANNFEYSFVNLVARDIIVDKIRQFVIKNKEYFCDSILSSITLNSYEYLFRIGFYDEVRYSLSSYKRDETEKWKVKQEAANKKLLAFGPEIREMFLDTIKRIPAIDTKTTKVIEIMKDLSPIKDLR
jgi:hypothetical protein